MTHRGDVLADYARRGGALPRFGPLGEAFWAGYRALEGTRRGRAGTLQRRAYEAGKERARVEPGLMPPRRTP